MNSIYYSNTIWWTLVVNLTFLLATLWLLKKGSATSMTKVMLGIFSLGWIGFIYAVSNYKILIQADISGLIFYIFTLISASLVLILFYFSPLKKVFDNIQQEDIQWVQGLRVFVATGFLMEGVLGVVPGWFSIMDGFLHVSSGFLALTAAIAVLKNDSSQNVLLWLTNIVGLADILIIVSSINFVVWNDLGPFHNMQSVVFYTGVLLLWFHFISISKLLQSK